MYCINWEGWQYTGSWEDNDSKGPGEITHELRNPNQEIVANFNFDPKYFPTHQDLKEWILNNG